MGPLFGVQLALGLSNPPSGIYQVWEECRTIYGTDGPFLFGVRLALGLSYPPPPGSCKSKRRVALLTVREGPFSLGYDWR